LRQHYHQRTLILRLATDAYNKGNYVKAYREFRSLSEQGDAAAQYNLGLLFDKGLGIGQSRLGALKWYHKAAERGVDLAQ